MDDAVVDDASKLVKPEERVRRITVEKFAIQRDDVFVYFDNFALVFRKDVNYNSRYHVWIAAGNSNPPFYLNENSEPWKVVVKMTIRLPKDQLSIGREWDILLSNESPSFALNLSTNYDGKVFDFEFKTVEGLGVEPLREYSIAGKYSDVTICVEEKKFALNKVFLASHSSVFEKLFFGDFVEKNQKEIELKDVSSDDFTDFLDVLTLPMHQLHMKNAILGVLKLADQWAVPLVLKKMNDMLLMYPGLRALSIADELWVANKYDMQIVLMRAISRWTPEDSIKYLSLEFWMQLKPTTSLQLCNTLGNRKK